MRLGAIGDVTNALVFAAAVRESFPAVQIGWVVHPLSAPLVVGHPCITRVHVWRRGGGPREAARVVRELRAERYGLAVDLQRIQKSALVARLSGAPRVLGYDRARTKEASWLWTNERVRAQPGSGHMLERYIEVARHLGCAAREPRRELVRDAAAEAWAEALVAELGGAPVLVNLGASKPENRWEPERFGALAQALAAEGVPVCLTGGPDDRPAATRAGAGARVRDLVGRTTLLELVALARRARLAVSCDTGPMHIAAAVGTPVVALFGPADPARTGPFGAGHIVVRAPHGRMAELALEPVLAATRARLGFARA